MRIPLLKFSSGLLFTLLMAVVFFTGSSATYAQAQTRSFQIGLWTAPKGPDSNIAVFWGDQPQPPGLSIWVNYPSATESLYTVYTDHNNNLPAPIDWSRIVAIEMDEPYDSVHDASFPCEDSVNKITAALAARAAELKVLAPKARFWVNFTAGDVDVMMQNNCAPFILNPLNQPYIDVISLDLYNVSFHSTLLPYYQFFAASPAKPDQQVALVPGVYSGPATNQAPYLQGYFGYASNTNQSCNLPLGSRGVTGIFDGCPVWIVMGWLANDCTPAACGATYWGMLDGSPTSVLIQEAWEAEVHTPLAPNLANQRSPEQIVQPILQLLLRPH